MRPVLFAVLAALVLSGCGGISSIRPYRMEIQQGNQLSQDKVAQLRRGMTREQVRFLLGTPLLTDVFHGDRWDYVYRLLPENSTKVQTRRLTLYFENDRLDHVAGDVTAAGGTEDEGAVSEAAFSKGKR